MARHNEDVKRRYRQNPEKPKAQAALRKAVAKGKIKKQPCEVCGAKKTEAHHDDYSKPFDVRWLCRIHHEDIHHPLLRSEA